jgi:hypothetical protein
MRQIGLVLCFILLGTSLDGAHGANLVAIAGTLFDKGPVTNAEIDLQLFQDEKCVKLFVSQKRDARAQRKLENCSRDLSSTHPDAEGRYRFTNLAPGWYAIHFVWSMTEKPADPVSFKRGEWVVLYPGYKDNTGKYDAFAQGEPFYVSGDSDVVKDYRNP